MTALRKQAVSFDEARVLGAAEADFADNFDLAAETELPRNGPVSNALTSGQRGGRRPNVPNFPYSPSTNSTYPNSSVGNTRATVSQSVVPPRPLASLGIGPPSGRYSPAVAVPALNNGLTMPRRLAQTRPRQRSGLLAVTLPHPLLLLAGLLLIMLLGFVLLSNLVQWWQTWQDDLTYGRPRTFQVDAWVGHNEQGNHQTHLIAQNINRQVTVIEYPGGDPTKLRVLVGPHLYGKTDDLLPVKLRLADVNGDSHADLIVTVGDQQIIYINDNGQFRLLRPDERSQIKVPPNDN